MFEIPQRRQNYSKMIVMICAFFPSTSTFAVSPFTSLCILFTFFLHSLAFKIFANMSVSSRVCLTISTRICLRYKFGLTGDSNAKRDRQRSSVKERERERERAVWRHMKVARVHTHMHTQ